MNIALKSPDPKKRLSVALKFKPTKNGTRKFAAFYCPPEGGGTRVHGENDLSFATHQTGDGQVGVYYRLAWF